MLITHYPQPSSRQRHAQYWSLLLFLFLAFGQYAWAEQSLRSGHWAIVGEEGLGSGINIIVQNQQVGLTIFTYDESGAATWYLATGTLQAEGTLINARLIGARDGQALDQQFIPATAVDTGQDIVLRFEGTTYGQFTLNGVTKTIRWLRFAGAGVTIPGSPDPGTVADIPDIEGEWVLLIRTPDQATQSRVLRFRRLLSFQPVGGDVPDAAIIYEHRDNDLSRAYFFCDTYAFDALGIRLPRCNLRLLDSERITEYEVPTANISLDRFDVALVSLPEAEPPQIFAYRIGPLPAPDPVP